MRNEIHLSYLRSLLPCLLLVLAGCHLVIRPIEEVVPTPDEARDDRQVLVTPIDRSKAAVGIESEYWTAIRSGRALVVGINPSYPPFGIPVTPESLASGLATERWTGFDVDLAKHLASTLGVPIELRAVRSTEVMDQLNNRSIDIALAGITRTARRAALVNFSAPYLTISQGALVDRRFTDGSRGTDEERRRNSVRSYDDLADIPGLKIGAATGTRPYRLALNNFAGARVTGYPTIADASRALISGEINALVHDDAYIRVWGQLHPQHAGRFEPLLTKVTEEPISMAIRKGDLEFLRFLDDYVAEVRMDGTVESLYRRHFLDAEWLKLAQLEETPR